MFHDQNCITSVDQAHQQFDQAANIGEVKAGGGFIQQVETFPAAAAGEFPGELDALGFTAGERGGGLAQANIVETHVDERLEGSANRGHVFHEGDRFFYCHLEYIRDAAALVENIQGLAVVASSRADFAGHEEVGKKVHFHAQAAAALASFAAPPFDVEGKASGFVTPRPGFRYLAEELADAAEGARIGGGVRSRRPSDRCLVDIDDLFDQLLTFERIEVARYVQCAMEPRGQGAVKGIAHESRLARPRDPRHHRQRPQRKRELHCLEVVGAAAPKNDSFAGRGIGPRPAGGFDGLPPGQPGAGG